MASPLPQRQTTSIRASCHRMAVINVDDVVVERGESERLAESTDLDEPPESITIDTQETIEYVEDDNDEEASAERAARSRRRLRNLLVFFIIILLVLVAIIGLFIWRNSTPPDVKQPDSDVLQTSTAGANATQFKAIDADSIPDLVSYFGMTPEAAAEAKWQLHRARCRGGSRHGRELAQRDENAQRLARGLEW